MRSRWTRILITALVLATGVMGIGPARAQGTPSSPVYDPSVCAADITGQPLSQACADLIAAFPKPELEAIPQDKVTLGNYDFWKVGPAETALYDKPGGAAVGSIPKGFNFVQALTVDPSGWIQIRGGQWVSEKDAKEAKPSYFTGVALKPGDLDHPFAWVLDKSHIYVSEYPGGPASSKTGRFLKRYEMVNLFATARDKDGKDWYMIGPNQWVKQTFLGKAQKMDIPQGKGISGFWVAVDLYEQTLVAYEDTTPVFATLVSTGLPTHDTNEGVFKVWARVDHDSMSGATGAPSAYALQFVPWVMYFDNGISLHGTYWHDLFGYRQSHGCVNLTISDARWMFDWTGKAPLDDQGKPLTYVYVYSTGKYGQGVIRQ